MKTERNVPRLLVSLILLCMFFILVGGASAQEGDSYYRFKFIKIDDLTFPLVEAQVSVTNSKGTPITDLTVDNFNVFEDDQEIIEFEISQINNPEQPLAIVFGIDTSSEFWLPQSKGISKLIVESLQPQDMVSVVTYSDEYSIEQEMTTDKLAVDNAINEIEPVGKPLDALNEALMHSLEILDQYSEPRVIIMFHNSIDSEIESIYERFADEAAERAVQVYAIGLGEAGRAYEDELNTIAESTDGKAYINPVLDLPPDIEPEELQSRLEAFFKDLLSMTNALRDQYLITYTSTLPEDGTEHELRVAVDYKGWQAEGSMPFIACPGVVKVCLSGIVPAQVIRSNFCFSPAIYSPDPAIERLDISMDGQVICSDIVSPFTCCLDPTTITEDTYEFLMSAMDASGILGELRISLYVRPPVKMVITEPGEDDAVSGRVKVSGQVDSLVELQRIEYRVNNQLLKSVDGLPLPQQGPPYIYAYEEDLLLGGVPFGNQGLSVTAVDTMDYSDEAQINVNIIPPIDIGDTSNFLWFALILLVVAVAAIILILGARKGRRRGTGAGTPAAGQAALRELEGLYPNQAWPLTAPDVHMGRKADENDIPLKGLKASRRMAVIHSHEGHHYISSLNPQNPILVNNTPVQQQQMLQPGDVIRGGESAFRYEVSG